MGVAANGGAALRMRHAYDGPSGYKARLRYYSCRDKHGVHGAAVGKVRKYVCHQLEAVESQFEAMLKNLAANPQLVADYTAPGSDGAERKALMARLSALRAEITRFDEMREKVWADYEAGRIAGEHVQERLDRPKERQRASRRRGKFRRGGT